jgi:photosystem II stability/assembly factor-like uncharacterized protein
LVGALAIDSVSPSTVYAVSSNSLGWGISKSMDSGENWSALNTGLAPLAAPPFYGRALVAVSPTTPATVYGGIEFLPSGGRLAKSTDGGVTWNAVDGGLTYIDVHTVAIDPLISSNIYAGMGGAGSSIPLFKSADGGANWTSLAQFQAFNSTSYGWISSLLVGPASPNLIYAAANAVGGDGCAVFKTKDGGANWIIAGPPGAQISPVMVLDAADSNTIYLGDWDWLDNAVYIDKSVDGGSTWRTQSYLWDIGPVNALVINPGNRATLYAGTPEGVLESADGGASWSNIGLINVTSLALDPGDSNTIYAASDNAPFKSINPDAGFLGLFKSTDGGASWAPINNGLASVLDSRSTITAIAFAPDNRNTLYVATSGRGVYKSLDGGASWGPLNEGLTNLDVRVLAVASNALYAVTPSGIFKAID